MKRRLPVLLCSALLACSEGETEPPTPAVTPQAITYADIEANDLFGTSCAYSSGNSIAPIVLARGDEAVMKIGGRIRRFRADPRSEEASLGSKTRYRAEDRVLLLAVEGEGTPSGYETVNFAGSLRLLDGAGTELYAATGIAQCGS